MRIARGRKLPKYSQIFQRSIVKVSVFSPKLFLSLRWIACSILYFSFNFIQILDNNGKLIEILNHANNKCEWLWTIHFKFMTIFFLNVILLCGISIFICWLNYGKLQIDHFYHPADTECAKQLFNHFLKLLFDKICDSKCVFHRLPWNQSTFLGYFVEIFGGILYSEGYYLQNGVLLLLFLSICIHHQAFYKMFQYLTVELNHDDGNRCVQKHMGKLVRFHVSAKEWVHNQSQ